MDHPLAASGESQGLEVKGVLQEVNVEDAIMHSDGLVPCELLPAQCSLVDGVLVQTNQPPFDVIDRVADRMMRLRPLDEFDAWLDIDFRNLIRQIHGNAHLWLFEYSPRTRLFLKLVSELFEPSDSLCHPHLMAGTSGLTVRQVMQQLAIRLRDALKAKDFQRQDRNWRGEAKRREVSINNYVNGLFEVYSKLLVLRLDFYLARLSTKEVDELLTGTKRWRDSDFDEITLRVDRLLNNRRTNAAFAQWVGYIVKFEFAPERGYHAHAIIFYHGSNVKNDSFHGLAIENYWIDKITAGLGTCHCANRSENKKKYRYVAVGMIDHRDAQKRVHLGRVINYLCKTDLNITSKRTAGQKLIRKGQLPRLTERRRTGRRRLRH